MKYKTKITPEGSGYIGRIYADENVIYESAILGDPILVTRELSEFIASVADGNSQTPVQQPITQAPRPSYPIIPGNRLSNTSPNPLVSTPNITPRQYVAPPRRGCCGRG